MNTLTFVDNHDTQRHGGVLTYKEEYLYKLAQAFHLAHEYGFKRVMSSYYFDDPDAGPPGPLGKEGPGKNAGCGLGWVCEHRWSTIANMVQVSF